MIPRRNLVTGGLLGGVLGALGDGDPAAAATAPGGDGAAADVNDQMVNRIVDAIGGLRAELQGLKAFPEITAVREMQLAHLRANGKFPDYVEVGTTLWFSVHDWHIRWQQPLTIGRDSLGRYTLQFNQTQLIMRVDAVSGFVGVPYDNR